MKIINLFGGPGSGKSTIAAGLFYEMKLLHLNVELVSEYAKYLYYDKRLENMMERQEYIYAKQHAMIQSLTDKVDYIVTDSPILLSVVYPDVNRHLYNTPPWPALDCFKDLVRKQFSFYDNVNIWLNRPDIFQVEGRLQNKEQSEWVDSLILKELQWVPYSKVNVGADTLTTILKSLNFI